VKKIEIIERITDANGSISENILTSWEHKNQFIPEIIRFGELKIYLQEQIVKKNDSDVNVVMRHICNIREKIEDDPGQPLYIQTVRGVGYRFNGNLGSK